MNERVPCPEGRRPRGRLGVLMLCGWLLLACSGGAPAEPTPLPADAVIPDQPTVVFPTFTPIQDAPTLTPSPVAATDPTPTWTPFDLPTLDTSYIVQDALAIPQQVVVLHAAPNGEVIGNVPSDQILTAVARSQDGEWLAVYTQDNQSGWVTLEGIHLYGGDALPIMDTIPPRADIPVAITRFPADPQAQAIGLVTGDGLRIRSAPTTEGNVLGNLTRDTEISVLGRNDTGLWLKISLWGTPVSSVTVDTGWVFAQYVQLDQDVNVLPVTD